MVSLLPHRYGMTGKGLSATTLLWCDWQRSLCLLLHHYGVTGKALSVCYHILMV